MIKCDVCKKPSLVPEKFGSSNVCKVCFIKINGPFWKKNYEKLKDAEHQKNKAIETAIKHNVPSNVLEGIELFFNQQTAKMKECNVCGEKGNSEKVGESYLCAKCFGKINTDEWQKTKYTLNEDVEEDRQVVLKIAQKKKYPQIVIDGINSHFDNKIQKDLKLGMHGKYQLLRVYDTKLVLETYGSFDPQELGSDYAKLKAKIQPNKKSSIAETAVKGILLGGGVAKTGIAIATNVAAGAVTGQISSRSELNSVTKGENVLFYENCERIESFAPDDTELGCIRIYLKNQQEFLFLFANYYDNKKTAIQMCSFVNNKIRLANSSTSQKAVKNESISVADEIMKLKNLADQGIISKKEFEQQKKKLLG